MPKKNHIALLVSLMLFICFGVSAAESLTGEWSGSANVSSVPFSLSATVKFHDDNTFSLSLTSLFGIICLEGKGYYTINGSTIAITPVSFSGLFASQLAPPERVGTVNLPYTFWDSKLHIAGNALGLNGTISLSRK